MAEIATDTASALKAAADKLGERLDADILILNYEIFTPIDFQLIALVTRRVRRPNILLFLTTEGGSPDSAFRMMRALQARYEKVFVAVTGWCKSAGTLMCIGAHEIYVGESGELGPLDVQIVKADEMDEQKSGLVAEAAFEKLQTEAFKFFMGFVRDFGSSEYRVTLKTASDIATKMTVGLINPIFDKLDPVTIGEDVRSNRLAQAYAERLNVHTKNLNRTRGYDALDNLLSGYPSHGFVIDCREASKLFKNVKPLSDEIIEVVRHLGVDSMLPRSRRQEQQARLEFLNDEAQRPTKNEEKSASGDGEGASRERATGRRNGAGNGHGHPAQGGGTQPPGAAKKARGRPRLT